MVNFDIKQERKKNIIKRTSRLECTTVHFLFAPAACCIKTILLRPERHVNEII